MDMTVPPDRGTKCQGGNDPAARQGSSAWLHATTLLHPPARTASCRPGMQGPDCSSLLCIMQASRPRASTTQQPLKGSGSQNIRRRAKTYRLQGLHTCRPCLQHAAPPARARQRPWLRWPRPGPPGWPATDSGPGPAGPPAAGAPAAGLPAAGHPARPPEPVMVCCARRLWSLARFVSWRVGQYPAEAGSGACRDPLGLGCRAIKLFVTAPRGCWMTEVPLTQKDSAHLCQALRGRPMSGSRPRLSRDKCASRHVLGQTPPAHRRATAGACSPIYSHLLALPAGSLERPLLLVHCSCHLAQAGLVLSKAQAGLLNGDVPPADMAFYHLLPSLAPTWLHSRTTLPGDGPPSGSLSHPHGAAHSSFRPDSGRPGA